MRFYHQYTGLNVTKVVKLVGLISRVLLIFVNFFLHFWKDLMSNLSKEARIENFCASECTLEVRENRHQNHCFSDYLLPYSHPKHVISRAFTIFSYFRVIFCEFSAHRVVLTHSGGVSGL